ncbi:MAG: proton-conducting transporter membrane subunit [Halomonas sp.]
MNGNGVLLLLILASSLVVGLVIFFLPDRCHRLRATLNLLGATIKILLVSWLLFLVHQGETFRLAFEVLPGIDLVLAADALSLLFASLSALLWFVTTVYAIGYLEGSPRPSRFFGFFSLCVSGAVGVALAGNLITFLVFYEVLMLATWPLVVHRGTPEALRAGRLYLAYTLGGGLVLLTGVVGLSLLAGSPDFTPGGYLAGVAGSGSAPLVMAFVLLIAGFGVKAALVPLHAWLPRAMVAPAPVSALLHAVAVVKAGAFGIVRVINDVFGVELMRDLGLATPLVTVAVITILYGSVQALRTDDLKQRLAFSTVSQISYIVLGVALAGPLGVIGGLVHLVHQGVTKITLFFCAGNFAETLGIHKISEMDGVGRRMPLTMLAFTIGALGMIGVPPLAGFVTKWYLGLGALEAGQAWVLGVLVLSGLLNAAYFLPPVIRGWLGSRSRPWQECMSSSGRSETRRMLLLPVLFTAVLTVGVGLLAGLPFSPLFWVEWIVAEGHFVVGDVP